MNLGLCHSFWRMLRRAAGLGLLTLISFAFASAGAAQDPPTQSPPQPDAPLTLRPVSDIVVDRASLPEAAYRRIESLNVRGADLRDLLRALGEEYGLNLIVDDALRQSATVRLTNLPVIEALVFLAEEYGLSLRQSGSVFRIRGGELPPPPSLPAPDISVRDGLLYADLSGQDVRDVVRALTLHSGLNLVVRPGVSGPVQGLLQDVPVERGIRALLETSGFAVRLRDGIYYIEAERAPPPTPDGTPPRGGRGYWVAASDTSVAFDVTNASIGDLVRDIAAQANLSLVAYQVPEGMISARAAVATVDDAFDLLLRGTDMTYRRDGDVYIIGDRSSLGIATTRLLRLGHLQAARVMEMIPELLRQRAAIQLVPEHNAIMVTGSRDVIAEIAGVLTEIDHPTPQILIEALVVDFEGQSLFELGLTFGRDAQRSEAYRGGNFTWGDGPAQQGGLDVRGGASDANYVLDRARTAAQRAGGGDLVQWIGRLPDDFFARIRALSTEGKVDVRSRPQIATLNGHEASLTIGTTQYYILRTATPISSPGDVIVQETERFERIEANVTLRVLPWVSTNGEVTAEIRPEFSTPVGSFEAGVPPTINTRVLESTVRLRDGETIVLGGLIQDTETVQFNKIPILGDLPLIGALFRNRVHDTRKSELVIFLTPHVFYGDERDDTKWRGVRDRTGVRDPIFEPQETLRGWTPIEPALPPELYGPLPINIDPTQAPVEADEPLEDGDVAEIEESDDPRPTGGDES